MSSALRMERDFEVRREDGWLTLTERERFAADALLGHPGLWRGLGSGAERARVFEIPPAVYLMGEGAAEMECPSATLRDWAEGTAGGTPPETQEGILDEVESWIDPVRRHVRAGGYVAPLELVAKPERLALVAPALVRIPTELCAVRCAWLEELCDDAQDKWRMVRFGMDDSSVRAEVDLSGAPPQLARSLVVLGVAALCCAAGWALPGLALVADPGIASRALERRPRRAKGRPMHHHQKEERA